MIEALVSGSARGQADPRALAKQCGASYAQALPGTKLGEMVTFAVWRGRPHGVAVNYRCRQALTV